MEADDDDTTVLSDNLSAASPQQLPLRGNSASVHQGRGTARRPGPHLQPAPQNQTPAPSSFPRKFAWANTVSVPSLRDRIQHASESSKSQDVTSVIAKISSDHRAQMAAQREAHTKAATILQNQIDDLQNINQATNSGTNNPQLMNPPNALLKGTSTHASTESKEFFAALTKMHTDHRVDIEEHKEENEKLRLQINELQSTITELLHRLSQPNQTSPTYDTGIWDSEDEIAAELSYATPMKVAAPAIVVKRRGKALSPSKVPQMDSHATQQSVSSPLERRILEGKKKARISTSPETKSMNPYQALADDADTESVISTNEEIVEIDSGNESEKAVQPGPETKTCINTSVAQSDDLNISYGTVPDDADSFVDSCGETELDNDIPPSITPARDPPARALELAALMTTRLSEAQDELKRMRVDSPKVQTPQTTSPKLLALKPDADESVDTGREE